MEIGNYTRAVSEYTIAQNLDSDRLEAYEKGLIAIVLLNSNTVERDFLTTVNSCIEFCGENSIKDVQIISALDILIASGNTEAACEILQHLHQSYSNSELIKEKIKSLNLETYQEAPVIPADGNTSVVTPEQQVQSATAPQDSQQQASTVQPSVAPQQQDTDDNENDEHSETAKPSASPSPSPTPSSSPSSAPTQTTAPTVAPANTPAPAPTQAPHQAESKPAASETQQEQTEE